MADDTNLTSAPMAGTDGERAVRRMVVEMIELGARSSQVTDPIARLKDAATEEAKVRFAQYARELVLKQNFKIPVQGL